MKFTTNRRTTLAALRTAAFSPAESAALARLAKLRTISPNEALTRLGGHSRFVFVLLDGSVEVQRASGDAAVITATPDRPVVIGELSALRDRLYNTATVTTVTTTTALVIRDRDLAAAMHASPRLATIVNEQRTGRLEILDTARYESQQQRHAAYRAYVDALDRTAR